MGNGDTISRNNRNSIHQNPYDAIVIGSGISGGWAAKELCENGLKTLVPERGRMVKHLTDYPTANKNPWDFKHHGKLSKTFRYENPIVSKCYALDETTQHFFVKDKEHPYIFVTDGACMASTGNHNPSLTFMALTARTASHAVSELKKQNL